MEREADIALQSKEWQIRIPEFSQGAIDRLIAFLYTGDYDVDEPTHKYDASHHRLRINVSMYHLGKTHDIPHLRTKAAEKLSAALANWDISDGEAASRVLRLLVDEICNDKVIPFVEALSTHLIDTGALDSQSPIRGELLKCAAEYAELGKHLIDQLGRREEERRRER